MSATGDQQVKATLSIDGTTAEFPVVRGTSGNDSIDFSTLTRQTGYTGLDYGFVNTASTKSAITFIDGDQGILRYRGIPIEQIAEKSRFVETAWLLIFADSPAGALTVVTIGLLVNTLFISTYLRPKLAADRSHVLDFYWMLLGLVTGVYTFGLAGVVLGPILIGILKAILDTVSNRASWRLIEQEYDD